MIRAFAAATLLAASSLSLAATSFAATPQIPSATAASSAALSTSPWWEKVTVTIAGDGQARSCLFETSVEPDSSQKCDIDSPATAQVAASEGHSDSGQYTRITFERRFAPGAQPASAALQIGDTLLGRQVMALAIDAHGAVKHCKILSAAGDMTPDYGCADAQAERFQASASSEPATAAREATMTILVYAHAEHAV